MLGKVPLDQAGTASITAAELTAGDHEIWAAYGGDANFGPSSATLHQTIGRATTTATLVASVASVASGAVVILEVTVRADAPTVPTGAVTFREGTTLLGTVALDALGIARLEAAFGWGSHTIAAIYEGDAAFGPSLATTTQIVQANTVTALWSTPTRSTYGESVALTATVRSAASDTISGDVTFSDGCDVIGVVPLDTAGEARLSTSSLGAGGHAVRADYGGDSRLAPSSAEMHLEVERAATSALLTAFVPPPDPPPPSS